MYINLCVQVCGGVGIRFSVGQSMDRKELSYMYMYVCAYTSWLILALSCMCGLGSCFELSTIARTLSPDYLLQKPRELKKHLLKRGNCEQQLN